MHHFTLESTHTSAEIFVKPGGKRHLRSWIKLLSIIIVCAVRCSPLGECRLWWPFPVERICEWITWNLNRKIDGNCPSLDSNHEYLYLDTRVSKTGPQKAVYATPCRSAVRAFRYARYGQGSVDSPIWLDNVQCTGNETRLVDCPARLFGSHNCRHRDDAGVSCDTSRGWYLCFIVCPVTPVEVGTCA